MILSLCHPEQTRGISQIKLDPIQIAEPVRSDLAHRARFVMLKSNSYGRSNLSTSHGSNLWLTLTNSEPVPLYSYRVHRTYNGVVRVVETEECDWCTECEAVCPNGAITCPFDIVIEPASA